MCGVTSPERWSQVGGLFTWYLRAPTEGILRVGSRNCQFLKAWVLKLAQCQFCHILLEKAFTECTKFRVRDMNLSLDGRE